MRRLSLPLLRPRVRLPEISRRREGNTARPIDPPLNAHFRVFIGKDEIGVAHISALQLSDPGRTADRIGQTITLTRALDGNPLFWRWRVDASQGRSVLRRVRIHHLSEPGNRSPINTFTLLKAQPVRWTGPTFDALEPNLAMEALELSYQTINWVQPVREDQEED